MKHGKESKLMVTGLLVAVLAGVAAMIGTQARTQIAASAVPARIAANAGGPPRVTVAGGAPTSSEPAAASDLAIDVIPTDGAVTTGPGLATFDFGEIRQIDSGPVEHTFTLRNANKIPVTIDRIQPSCGCTTAVIDDGSPMPAAKTTIAPGGTVHVHVSIDRTHLIPGHNIKTVWVYVAGQASPAATLEMEGVEDAAASLVPTSLDFGTVAAGQSRSLELTLTYDAHYPNGDKLEPKLQPETQDVTLTLERASGNTKTYRVDLSPHAGLGSVQELVAVEPVGSGPTLTALSSITAVVNGEISAAPMSIAFGAVAAHTSAVQSLTVSATRPGVLAGTTVRAESGYLTPKLIPAGDTSAAGPDLSAPLPAGATSATLQVTLSPKAPQGALESHVILTTADGQRLVIPVWVFISST
jgi:hypothetical protein